MRLQSSTCPVGLDVGDRYLQVYVFSRPTPSYKHTYIALFVLCLESIVNTVTPVPTTNEQRC